MAEHGTTTMYRDGCRCESCRAAKKAQQKGYYEANREKLLAQQKGYQEANREKVLARKKAYQEANREKVLAQKKAYYLKVWRFRLMDKADERDRSLFQQLLEQLRSTPQEVSSP